MSLSNVSNRPAVPFSSTPSLLAAQRASAAPQASAAKGAQASSQRFTTDSFEAPSALREARSAEAKMGPGGISAKTLVSQGHHPASSVYQELSYNQPGLGGQKEAVWKTAIAAGANKQEAALLVAEMMQEGRRDPSKDDKGASANYGPFNLNRDLLTQFGGVSKSKLGELNKAGPAALRDNVKAALTAMRRMGANRYLDHVRGGASGYEHPNSDTHRFERSLANNAAKVLHDYEKNPRSLSSDHRYASNIPPI